MLEYYLFDVISHFIVISSDALTRRCLVFWRSCRCWDAQAWWRVFEVISLLGEIAWKDIGEEDDDENLLEEFALEDLFIVFAFGDSFRANFLVEGLVFMWSSILLFLLMLVESHSSWSKPLKWSRSSGGSAPLMICRQPHSWSANNQQK